MARGQYLRIYDGTYHAIEHHVDYESTKCGIEIQHNPNLGIFDVKDTEIAHFEEEKGRDVCIECLHIDTRICTW